MKLPNEVILDWASAQELNVIGTSSEEEIALARAQVSVQRQEVVKAAIGQVLNLRIESLEARKRVINTDLELAKTSLEAVRSGEPMVKTPVDNTELLKDTENGVSFTKFYEFGKTNGYKPLLATRISTILVRNRTGTKVNGPIVTSRPFDEDGLTIAERDAFRDENNLINVPILLDAYIHDELPTRGFGPQSDEFISHFLESWLDANPDTDISTSK